MPRTLSNHQEKTKKVNMAITKIHARSVYDSRGNPTVEVDVSPRLVPTVPSSHLVLLLDRISGQHEAVELRDGDKDKWAGKGVTKAVANVNDIIGPALIKENIDVKDQSKIDEFLNSLDGTPNKGKLGANAILGVSFGCCQGWSCREGYPTLRPRFRSCWNQEALRSPSPHS
ncbi:hypothetical protein DID88_004088 [Monilinia fructigena]|uniref:2-phospho-D-glycerate hydro-lyase n=1 Tax=Monilinia fructigena TaxID=38457 RepID=A0A395IRT7_9HELO|nr:hypothetical protein DID88_004088 [Monilinia fructigena]